MLQTAYGLHTITIQAAPSTCLSRPRLCRMSRDLYLSFTSRWRQRKLANQWNDLHRHRVDVSGAGA